MKTTDQLNTAIEQTTTHAGTSGILIDTQRFLPIAVSSEHDLTKPLPLRIKIDYENPNLWAAKSSNDPARLALFTAYVFPSAEGAQDHLRGLDPERQLLQNQVREARRLLKAQTIPADQYDGWLCDGEDFHSSTQEYLESLDEDPASPWLYATYQSGFNFDLEDRLDSYLDDEHHEGAGDSLVDYDALLAFWKEWAAKQSLTTYNCNYDKIVVLDQERFDADIAAAKALVEAQS